MRFLSISNLAVIDRLELEFAPGLNVLTGETGAGKSILVGAVGLLVGGRASAPNSCGPERTPQPSRPSSKSPTATEVIVRREVSAQGRSRAFVDGALVTSAALRDAAGVARRSARSARAPGAARSLDASRSARRVRRPDPEARGCCRRVPPMAARCDDERARLAASEQQKASRAEFLAFQLVGDRSRRDRRRARTRSWRRRGKCSPMPIGCSGSAPTPTPRSTTATKRRLPALASVWKKVGELAALDPKFAPYLEAREGVKSQLEDLAFFLRSYSQNIDASPARLQDIEDRLALLERLKKKHGPALADVIANATDAPSRAARPRARNRARSRARRGAGGGTRAYLRGRRRISRGAAASGAKEFSRALEQALADLAMAEDALRGPLHGCLERRQHGAMVRTRHRRGGVLHLAESGRGPAAAGADRLGRRAVADHARAEDAGDHRRTGQDADLRRSGRRHRRAPSRTSSARGSSGSASASRCCASRTCRRLPPTARRTSGSRSP